MRTITIDNDGKILNDTSNPREKEAANLLPTPAPNPIAARQVSAPTPQAPQQPIRSRRTIFPATRELPEYLRKDYIPNVGGRPPIFSDPDDMAEACAKYFASCWTEKKVVTIDGQTGDQTVEYVPVQVVPYTMAGLAMALGMTTETLRKYRENDRFSATVLNARAVIEGFCEKQLHEGKNANVIWNLMQCNFGYRMPKTEAAVELTGKDGEPLNPTTANERARATREQMLAELGSYLPSNPNAAATGEGN